MLLSALTGAKVILAAFCSMLQTLHACSFELIFYPLFYIFISNHKWTFRCILLRSFFLDAVIQVWLVEGCSDGWPSGTFFQLQTGFLVSTSQTLSRLLMLFWWSALGTSVFLFRVIKELYSWGFFSTAEIFQSSPDLCLHTILSLDSGESSFDLTVQFLLWLCPLWDFIWADVSF